MTEASNVALPVGAGPLTVEEYRQVVHQQRPVALASAARARMEASRASLMRQLEGGARIYGVNTGYGANSGSVIALETIRRVQRNTVLSHAVGTGELAPTAIARGMLVLKAAVLAQGYSAVRPMLVEALIALLNADALPLIPTQGSLAASGDLIPSAHAALPLLGEGEVVLRGRRVAATEALIEAGLEPLTLEEKEGLALVNGTAFTLAYALENIVHAAALLQTGDLAAATTLQALRGHTDAFDPRLIGTRAYAGAVESAATVRALSAQSALLRERPTRVHDPYCLRCVPQVHGASRDALRYVEAAVRQECAACSDNPLVFWQDDSVLSGGNFHAQPLALPMDTLAVVVAEIGSLAQRRIHLLIAPIAETGLPPSLTWHGETDLGLVMLNTAAAALVSENKTLCFPASVDSIAIDAVEDHVSMGSVAARKAASIIDNTARILAIELLCACQALDLQTLPPSAPIAALHSAIRRHASFVAEDRPLHTEIAAISERVLRGELAAIVAPWLPRAAAAPETL